MQSFRMLIFISILSVGSVGKQTNKHLMADPLFGILYNPQQVKFDEAPALVEWLSMSLLQKS
jgi:hypothetical protein